MTTPSRQDIARALASEIERQAPDVVARLDLDALAAAVETAMGPQGAAGADEGKRPDQLNATNDD